MEVDTEPTIAVPPVEPSIEPVEPVEALRSIRIIAVVKVAPRQHANSGNTLEEWTLQTQNVDTAQTAVWNHYQSKRRAIVDDSATPISFNISDSDPTIEDIDSYIHFEKDSRKYCFGPKLQFHQITNMILSNWHTASLMTTVTMQILKHGDSIKTASQFTQYNKAVLQPIIMDRGGAPAEPLHIDIMVASATASKCNQQRTTTSNDTTACQGSNISGGSIAGALQYDESSEAGPRIMPGKARTNQIMCAGTYQEGGWF
ncbi:hypothetical protein HDU80_007353 [Chytriomyces hyalinus]|nr:hypothetical protein HDU80_007353 [Chytriomyces hyalinus]